MTTATLYKMVGDGPLKRKVQTDIDLTVAAANVKTTTDKNATDLINGILDGQASQYGFDNIAEACSYATTDNQYTAISKSFISWRAGVWSYLEQQIAAIDETNYKTVDVSTIVTGMPPLSNYI